MTRFKDEGGKKGEHLRRARKEKICEELRLLGASGGRLKLHISLKLISLRINGELFQKLLAPIRREEDDLGLSGECDDRVSSKPPDATMMFHTWKNERRASFEARRK